MAKFKFKLEQLLSLRQYEQDQAQIELGKAVQVEQKIQNDLDTLAQQYAVAKKLGKGEKDFAKIAETQQFFAFIKQQQEKLFEDMAKAKLVTEEKRVLFNKALQKTESLKKLREREYDAYKEAEKQAEKKALDDVLTFKYN